jgi:hypothetical protein
MEWIVEPEPRVERDWNVLGEEAALNNAVLWLQTCTVLEQLQ